MWEDAWDAWDFCCFHMKIIGNSWKFKLRDYQRYIYSLGMPSPNRRRRATLFLGVAVLCAPALVFAYAGWTIRRLAEWGIWRLVTCDMVHQFPWKIFISRHRWHQNWYSACRLGIHHCKKQSPKFQSMGKASSWELFSTLLSRWTFPFPRWDMWSFVGGYQPWRLVDSTPSNKISRSMLSDPLMMLCFFVTTFYTPEN